MNAECYICFYNFRKLQGWRWWAIRILGMTKHTHAHLEFLCKKNRLIFLTLDSRPTRFFWLGLQTRKFLGLRPYAAWYVGKMWITDEDLQWVADRPLTNAWSIIRYAFYDQWTRSREIPENCIILICDFLRRKGKTIPRMFSPKQLWRYLNDGNNVSRTSPCGQDNACQLAG